MEKFSLDLSCTRMTPQGLEYLVYYFISKCFPSFSHNYCYSEKSYAYGMTIGSSPFVFAFNVSFFLSFFLSFFCIIIIHFFLISFLCFLSGQTLDMAELESCNFQYKSRQIILNGK